jgi:hypothetical protein
MVVEELWDLRSSDQFREVFEIFADLLKALRNFEKFRVALSESKQIFSFLEIQSNPPTNPT